MSRTTIATSVERFACMSDSLKSPCRPAIENHTRAASSHQYKVQWHTMTSVKVTQEDMKTSATDSYWIIILNK